MVGSVDGRLIPQRLPIQRLNLYVRVGAGNALALLLLEVLQRFAWLADVLQLVVAVRAIHILLDWRYIKNKVTHRCGEIFQQVIADFINFTALRVEAKPCSRSRSLQASSLANSFEKCLEQAASFAQSRTQPF